MGHVAQAILAQAILAQTILAQAILAQVFPLKYRLGILICVPPSCGDHGLYDTGSTTSKTSFDVTTP
jgi:hypothetical protein